jgi:predicted metal-dependent HD superfamily phosphohydrolase
MNLEVHWKSLAHRLNLQHNVQGSLYINLTHRYGEPHREYHNLNHIKSMLDYFDTVRHTAEAPDALEWAIWFHDVIYDPQLKDNEKLSSVESNRMARAANLPKDFADLAASLIMATAAHEPNSPDESLIVDLDLAILGAPETQFDAYEHQIRKEYIHVPDEAFRVGRSKVLHSFLDRDRIYTTDAFYYLEQPARSNLKRSLTALNAPPST